MSSERAELLVRLSPGAAQNRIQGWEQDGDGRKRLKISVTAVPERGKANKALVNLLAKTLKLPKSGIEIVKGEIDRNKTLILKNISQGSLETIIRKHFDIS